MSTEPTIGKELRALLSSLSFQRDHVLGILEGLSEEDLRRPVLPSGWTCLGLVQHLALDVERFWFLAVAGGHPEVLDAPGPEDAWQVAPDVSADAVFDLYRHEIEIANGILSETSVDAPPAWWPEHLFPGWRHDDVRSIVLHVITETACHAGHLDAVRELIDGRQFMDLS